jgi:hypothetical protein
MVGPKVKNPNIASAISQVLLKTSQRQQQHKYSKRNNSINPLKRMRTKWTYKSGVQKPRGHSGRHSDIRSQKYRKHRTRTVPRVNFTPSQRVGKGVPQRALKKGLYQAHVTLPQRPEDTPLKGTDCIILPANLIFLYYTFFLTNPTKLTWSQSV